MTSKNGRSKTATMETIEKVEKLESVEEPKPEQKKKRGGANNKKTYIDVVIDAGRSRIKCQAFVNNKPISELVILDSLICAVDTVVIGDLGAFSMCRKQELRENKKSKTDIEEFFVVGSAAAYQQREYIAMTDADDHKINYFPVLVGGAITAIPNILDYATATGNSKRLDIRLTTLSLANPKLLADQVSQIKWLKIDGQKVTTKITSGLQALPEGYGAAIFGSEGNKSDFVTFDIGYGTATITSYSNQGSLPKRRSAKPNGGGGIATLIRDFAEQISNKDSCRIIRPSDLRSVVESATCTDGVVEAISPDGNDIGKVLDAAIRSWMKDSPLTFALDKLGTMGRTQRIVCCGGGFAIHPVRELVKNELLRRGIPENHLVIPPTPGTVAIEELSKLFKNV